MGMSQLSMAGVIVLALIGYWWWTSGRHGSRAVHHHLGLEKGEEIRATFNAFFKLNFGIKDVGLAAVGVSRTPKSIFLTITNSDVLVFRVQDEEPRRFSPGSFGLTLKKEKDDKLVGLSGTLETADVYEVTADNMAPFHVTLARSAAKLLNGWNDGAETA